MLNSLRKLTKEVVTDITPPSSALHNLTEIVTKHKLSGVELGEAARILHASVQRIVGPLEEQQFNETLQTLTMVREIYYTFIFIFHKKLRIVIQTVFFLLR